MAILSYKCSLTAFLQSKRVLGSILLFYGTIDSTDRALGAADSGTTVSAVFTSHLRVNNIWRNQQERETSASS